MASARRSRSRSTTAFASSPGEAVVADLGRDGLSPRGRSSGRPPCWPPRGRATPAPAGPAAQRRRAPPGLDEHLGGDVAGLLAGAEPRRQVAHDLGVVGAKERIEVVLLTAKPGLGRPFRHLLGNPRPPPSGAAGPRPARRPIATATAPRPPPSRCSCRRPAPRAVPGAGRRRSSPPGAALARTQTPSGTCSSRADGKYSALPHSSTASRRRDRCAISTSRWFHTDAGGDTGRPNEQGRVGQRVGGPMAADGHADDARQGTAAASRSSSAEAGRVAGAEPQRLPVHDDHVATGT